MTNQLITNINQNAKRNRTIILVELRYVIVQLNVHKDTIRSCTTKVQTNENEWNKNVTPHTSLVHDWDADCWHKSKGSG
jgi:hypothetical protein